MNEQLTVIEHVSGLFREEEQRLNGTTGSLLHTLRKKSMDQLSTLGFPDRKHEDWKYTSVQRLLGHPYKIATTADPIALAPIPGLESFALNMVNGKFIPDHTTAQLAAAGITVKPLSEVVTDQAFFSKFSKANPEHEAGVSQAFQLMNFALQSGGFLIDIPANTLLDKPIEIRMVHHDPEASISNPLYFIQAGTGSEASIIERYERPHSTFSPQGQHLTNAAVYVALAQNAKLTYIHFQDMGDHQNLVYRLGVDQKRDSRFDYYTFDWGGALVRNNIDIDLLEQNTYTSLQAGFVAKQNQSMDHQTMINHAVPHCESHELYKGIIDDQASAAFNGKVFVRPDAQKTNAFQQNDTLVLSPHAVMNSKPQLEIFADDVKCSHGATIGQLDQAALFYLKARGIDQMTASHILKAAFLSQVIDRVPTEPVQAYIRQKMNLDQ